MTSYNGVGDHVKFTSGIASGLTETAHFTDYATVSFYRRFRNPI